MDPNAPHPPAIKQLITGSNDLAFKLLSELVKKDSASNVLISSLSISFVLCMLYNGAGGATRRALENVLQLHGFSAAQINQACLELRSLLADARNEDLIRLANAIWTHSSERLDRDFTHTVKHFYAADVRSLDFNDPATLATINEWAKEQTDGKIYSLLSGDDISAATECIVAAAVYFKGAWATPFSPDATSAGTFYLADGQTRDVRLMQRTGLYQFHQTSHFQAIGLPYRGGRLSMYVFLPSENSSPAELLRRMNARAWEDCLTNMIARQVSLFLPRFKVKYEIELNNSLSVLGLGEIFGAGADFSPMGLGSHGVEKFKHKTMVEVNEEGAEAAAVSTAMLGRSLALTLLVNRPFFWAIRDNLSRTLIFTSLVLEPH